VRVGVVSVWSRECASNGNGNGGCEGAGHARVRRKGGRSFIAKGVEEFIAFAATDKWRSGGLARPARRDAAGAVRQGRGPAQTRALRRVVL
jgi:hypothetical protein